MASYYSGARRPRPRRKTAPPPPIEQQPTRTVLATLSTASMEVAAYDEGRWTTPENVARAEATIGAARATYAAAYAELARRGALPHWAVAPETRQR